jgi:hypothetical protein
MANLTKQEKIARGFVAAHKGKHSLIDSWRLPDYLYSKKEKYAYIYSNMMLGSYGNCEPLNAVYDDESGEVIKEATEFQIEISCGNVYCFEV